MDELMSGRQVSVVRFSLSCLRCTRANVSQQPSVKQRLEDLDGIG